MEIATLHDWNVTPSEARALQAELAGRVDVRSPLPPWKTVAAADVSFDRGGDWIYAAVLVLERDTFAVIESASAVVEARFPYVPGLLSFREAPGLLEAFRKLDHRPDIVLCDGQGIAHPRRLGIASHLGLWLDLPTIGCAKSRLFGKYREPGPNRGDRSPLLDGPNPIGAVLRTKPKTNPLFVSPGHRCTLDDAVAAVLACITKYRLPEPARQAHEEVNRVRRATKEAEQGERPSA